MKSTHLGFLYLVLFGPLLCQAGEIPEFDTYLGQLKNYNFAQVEKFLENEAEQYKQNPEYYVLLLNYVSLKGNPSHILIGSGEPQEGDIELQEIDSGQTVGFLGREPVKDESLIVDGLKRTQQALSYFNTRLDIHFGVVYLAQTIERWDIAGEQLVEILKTSIEIKNQWIWGKVSSMEGEPENFMLNTVLARTGEMFDDPSPEAEKAFVEVSEALIKYYPERVFGYANLGAHYLLRNQLERAREYYERAKEVNPKDDIVLENLQRLSEMQAEQ